MTRKDYTAIAKALCSQFPGATISTTADGAHLMQWTYDRQAIADVLAADNPRFDRQRFYSACEGRK